MWEKRPSVAAEIPIVQERMEEIKWSLVWIAS